MSSYESDFYGWVTEQANLLKSGRYRELDTANLLEEIEGMGKSEKRALESRLAVLLQHLLKWQYQPVRRSKSWELTIKEQRLRIEKLLRESPSLKRQLDSCLADAYEFAIIQTAQETGMDESSFPNTCPWQWQQILNNDFLPL